MRTLEELSKQVKEMASMSDKLSDMDDFRARLDSLQVRVRHRPLLRSIRTSFIHLVSSVVLIFHFCLTGSCKPNFHVLFQKICDNLALTCQTKQVNLIQYPEPVPATPVTAEIGVDVQLPMSPTPPIQVSPDIIQLINVRIFWLYYWSS